MDGPDGGPEMHKSVLLVALLDYKDLEELSSLPNSCSTFKVASTVY